MKLTALADLILRPLSSLANKALDLAGIPERTWPEPLDPGECWDGCCCLDGREVQEASDG
jgi:hypothetical protein